MSSKNDSISREKKKVFDLSFDLLLKMGGLFLVVFLCFKIIQPFINVLLWSLIISIILFPVFELANRYLVGREKLSALLVTLVSLSVLVFPSIWLVNQLVEGAKEIAALIPEGKLRIPPPSESVADWPYIGEWLYDYWMQASENLGESLKGFKPQISNFGEKLFNMLANTGMGILQFAVSIILGGVFLVFSRGGSRSGSALFEKIAGDRGEEFKQVSLSTIRNVATGVLAVAIIQTTLLGIGLVLADIPLAAVWIIIILIMSIAQIPVILFNIPMIIYIFAFMDPLPAVLWSVYLVVMGLMDNFLKPIFMSQGSSVPMLIIFFGAIGGFIAFGFMGLFLGAIILSLAYKLYITWLEKH